MDFRLKRVRVRLLYAVVHDHSRFMRTRRLKHTLQIYKGVYFYFFYDIIMSTNSHFVLTNIAHYVCGKHGYMQMVCSHPLKSIKMPAEYVALFYMEKYYNTSVLRVRCMSKTLNGGIHRTVLFVTK